MPFLHARIWEITCQFNYYFTVKRVSQKQTKPLLMHIKAQKKNKQDKLQEKAKWPTVTFVKIIL